MSTTGITTHSILSGAAGVAAIPNNPRRQALIISGLVAQNVLLWLGPDDGSAIGLLLPAGALPLVLTREQLGDAIQCGCRLGNAANAIVTYCWAEALR